MELLNLAVFLLAICVFQCAAQFPRAPEGVKVVKSKFHEGISISYKEVYNLSLTLLSLCLSIAVLIFVSSETVREV